MAKKIRFPLIMEKGVEVRDIVSLRTHFSLPPLIEYKKNGKLVTWLRDRYETDLATAVELIDDNDSQIAQKLCEVFGVEYTDKISADIKKQRKEAGVLRNLRNTPIEEAIAEDDIADFPTDIVKAIAEDAVEKDDITDFPEEIVEAIAEDAVKNDLTDAHSLWEK